MLRADVNAFFSLFCFVAVVSLSSCFRFVFVVWGAFVCCVCVFNA